MECWHYWYRHTWTHHCVVILLINLIPCRSLRWMNGLNARTHASGLCGVVYVQVPRSFMECAGSGLMHDLATAACIYAATFLTHHRHTGEEGAAANDRLDKALQRSVTTQ
jgi:hypothetical protein